MTMTDPIADMLTVCIASQCTDQWRPPTPAQGNIAEVLKGSTSQTVVVDRATVASGASGDQPEYGRNNRVTWRATSGFKPVHRCAKASDRGYWAGSGSPSCRHQGLLTQRRAASVGGRGSPRLRLVRRSSSVANRT